MKITRPRLIGAAVAASAAAVLLPSSAAVAYVSPPLVLQAQAQSPARLVAHGAAVDVSVEYSCTADYMSISLQLTQRAGNHIVTGSGYTSSVLCDGATHLSVIRLSASSSDRPFKAGEAATTTSFWGYLYRDGRWLEGYEHADQTIMIKK